MNNNHPDSYKKLLDYFTRFPTVGPRTAARFISYLMNQPNQKVNDFIKAVEELKNKIKFCSFCFCPFQGEGKLGPICSNKSRNQQLICIVEKETDLFSIEKTNKYKGLYFILGGTVSKLKKEDIKKVRTKELKKRIKNPKKFGIDIKKFKEIIIATNPTTEGEATSSVIERELKKLPKEIIPKITHLGRGLPKGGELEYADEETLGAAFEGRK